MSVRARTLAASTAMALLLSGCILFPPFWNLDPMAPGAELVVENETDENWVLSFGADMPAAFAIGAGETGTVAPFGLVPTEIVLLDPECTEIDRMDWDASASGVLISDGGALSSTDATPTEPATAFVEFWDCMGEALDVPPEPGAPLPEAGGTIVLSSGGGAVFNLEVASATVTPFGDDSIEWTDTEHAWSPDGTRLAFTRISDTDYDSNLYLAAADGTDAVLLVEDATAPRWSPDGTRIAYISTDPFAEASGLAVIAVDGGEPLELAEDAFSAAWSPAGEQLAFVTAPSTTGFEMPPTELRIVDADGTGLRTLADAAPFTVGPAWSPDGTRLAFVSLPDGVDPGAFDTETVVAVHDLQSDVTSVIAQVDGAGLGEPAWSPDGESVAFTIMTPGLFGSSGALATASASGGPITRVNEGPGVYFATPIWSPAGGWLAVSRSAETDLTFSLVAFRPDGTDETVLATGVTYATAWRGEP